MSHTPATEVAQRTREWRKGLAKLFEETTAGQQARQTGANAGFRLAYRHYIERLNGNQQVPLMVSSSERESLIVGLLPVWGSTIL
jgi:hypothetical protein